MTTTETIDAILAACRTCVELGEKATPRPYLHESSGKYHIIEGVLRYRQFANPLSCESDGDTAAFIAHACNIGVAACKSLILAIEALRKVEAAISGRAIHFAGFAKRDASNALDAIAQAWRGAV